MMIEADYVFTADEADGHVLWISVQIKVLARESYHLRSAVCCGFGNACTTCRKVHKPLHIAAGFLTGETEVHIRL